MENIQLVSRRRASEQEAANAIEAFLARKHEHGINLVRKLQRFSSPQEVKLSAEKEMALSMSLNAIKEHLEDNLDGVADEDYDSSDNEDEPVKTKVFLTHSEKRRVQAMQKREEKFTKRAPKQAPPPPSAKEKKPVVEKKEKSKKREANEDEVAKPKKKRKTEE